MSQENKALSTFTFQNPEVQRAANTVYNFKVAYETANAGKTYQFKTDYERMQNLLGKAHNFAVSTNGAN